MEDSQLRHAPKPGDKVDRLPSHTATVTYHALKGEYGMHRTYVPWEPKNEAGEKGVNVTPEHCWMYAFAVALLLNMAWRLALDLTVVHQVLL